MLPGSADLEWRPAARTLHARVELDHGIVVWSLHVGGDDRRRFVLSRFRLHLGRHLAEVEGGRAAVQAHVAGLRDPMALVFAGGIELHLSEEGAEQPATALARADKEHQRSRLRNPPA